MYEKTLSLLSKHQNLIKILAYLKNNLNSIHNKNSFSSIIYIAMAFQIFYG